MTQQATAPAAAKKPTTFIDITRDIIVKAGLQNTDIPGLHKAVWFQGPWESTQEGTDIRNGQPFPLNPGLTVFRIFEDGDEIRVYCLQGAAPDGKDPKDPIPPSCYRLNKRARTYTATSMTFPLFKDEMASEFRMQVMGLPDDTTCEKCGMNVPGMPFCGNCGQKLPEDVEEDEDEPEEPAATTNGAAVTPTS